MNQKHFDLIVVGAGILGTFHAYHAARLGKRVLLTEKDSYPVNATVRNFGQVVPSAMSAVWFNHGKRGTEIYAEIQKKADITVRRNGSVYVASDEQEQQLLHELKAIMDMRGYQSQLLSTEQTIRKWPPIKKTYCRESLFFEQEVSVEPEAMIYRVLNYLHDSMPTLRYLPGTVITGCAPSGSQVIVSSSDGQVFTAEKVVICNGGEFKLLFPELFRLSGIVISKLHMLRTIPLPEVDLKGNILTGLTIRRYESFSECPSFATLRTPPHLQELKSQGIHILFKQATDHTIIIGDSHEYAAAAEADDLGFSLRESINELMLAEAERIVTFDVRKIAMRWAGFYPQHPDKDVVEYDLEDCIHIRTAVGGKGMTSGPGYAEASIRRIFNLS